MTDSSDNPLVTVITPAYNQADYLPETIESILAQAYPNLEYIVLNDGSTDNTLEVMQRYADRIIIESHENMGEARTVNRGFELATGEYIIVVNADDPLLPGLIRAQVDYLKTHPDAVATYPDFRIIDEHSNVIEDRSLPDYDRDVAIRRAWCVPGPGAMIRRTAIKAIGGRDLRYRYNSDMDFWLRLSLRGSIHRVPLVLAIRREHSAARGNALRAEVGDEIITVIETLFAEAHLTQEVRRLYRESLSSAHFEAGARAATFTQRRRHFVRSFRLYPMNWIRHRRALWQYGALLLPAFAYNALRPVFGLFAQRATR